MQYQLPIFENLCPSWEKFTQLGIRRTFLKGSQVFDIANPISGVYLVTKGSVEVILYTQRGPEKVLYYVGPGCIFGEVSCFVAGDSGEARVQARSDLECYFFSRETIEGTIARQHPELLIELIRAAAYKIRMYGVLLQDSLDNDNFVRVCKMLVHLANFKQADIQPTQKVVSFQADMTQNDLARLMGIHRVTVAKALGNLRGMGILEHFSKKSVLICDYSALYSLVAEGNR